MARKVVNLTDSEAEDDETQRQAEELAELNREEGGEVFRVTDELRGTQGVELMIIRLTGTEDQRGYCGMMPVAEFSHDNLKRIYGSGRYKVRIQGPKGFLPGGGNIKIADTPQAAKATGGGGDFLSYMEMKEKRDSERSSKLWELAMVSIPTVLAGLFNRNSQSDMPALIAALKPAPGPTITDLTGALANMQQLTAPKNTESQVDTILKVFGAAHDLMGDREGGKEGAGSNWTDVIRDLIKVAPEAIKPMLEARMAQMQPGAAVVTSVQPIPQPNPAAIAQPVASVPSGVSAPPPAPSFVPTAAAPTGSEDQMFLMFMPLIKANLAKIAGWAEKNRDPEVYADVLVDELPDNFGSFIPLEKILEYLNHEKWFETIVEIEPKLQSHRDWCNECRLVVIEIMKGFKEELEPERISDPDEASSAPTEASHGAE